MNDEESKRVKRDPDSAMVRANARLLPVRVSAAIHRILREHEGMIEHLHETEDVDRDEGGELFWTASGTRVAEPAG